MKFGFGNSDDKRRIIGLATLFGLLYFVQGISEPTEGLIAQPTRSLLREWGYSTQTVATFMALLAAPWWIKPIYGLLTDFVPLGGTRRRSWLLVTTLATSVSLIALYAFPSTPGMAWLLLAWLAVPTFAVAFSDVVVDALMVEEGQPRGLTGQLQSVAWACTWAATILTGLLGGFLSERNLQETGFLIAGLATGIGFLVALVVVREPHRLPNAGDDRTRARDALRALGKTLRDPAIVTIGAFLFLWNFNPFSTSVLNDHMIRRMGFSEQLYGVTISIQALGSLAASLVYAGYCRRLTVGQLLHLSIATGVLATLAYWGLDDVPSAVVISFLVGFVYMTGTIVQLDLAARVCEIDTAGTTFALLMALTNLAVSLSMDLGGRMYERLAEWRNPTFAFEVLVGIGALSTSFCWLLVPTLRQHCQAKSSQP